MLEIRFGGYQGPASVHTRAAQVFGQELKKRLANRRIDSMMFGLPAYLLLAIPFVNLILLPVAVAGGTVFWVKNLRQ